jgi:hypothetical protein
MTLTARVENSGAIENTDSFGNYLIHGIDEIILPDTISWWPTAPGWQVLGVLVVVLLAVQASRWVKRWWHNRYRREALKQLAAVQQQADMQLQDVVAVLPYYMKVTALQAYPRKDIASLSGNDWLLFLDAHYAGPSFSKGVGKKLLSVAYLPREQWQLDDQESNTLIRMSRHWIAEHIAEHTVKHGEAARV